MAAIPSEHKFRTTSPEEIRALEKRSALNNSRQEYYDMSDVAYSTQEDIQGYYAYTTKFYDDEVTNTQQSLLAEEWTDITPLIDNTRDKMPRRSSEEELGAEIYDQATNEFSLAGLSSGSQVLLRMLLRIDPDDDNSSAMWRLVFTTNEYTQQYLAGFEIESQLMEFSQGADVFYSDEALLSFFVGGSLRGSTIAESGKFKIQVKTNVDSTLEVMGVTMNVHK